VSLRFAAGNLRCSRPAGSRSNSRLRRSDNREPWSAGRCAPRHILKGTRNRTATRAIAALGPRGRWRYAPRMPGRAQRWPV